MGNFKQNDQKLNTVDEFDCGDGDYTREPLARAKVVVVVVVMFVDLSLVVVV